jgi:hypothetical protein
MSEMDNHFFELQINSEALKMVARAILLRDIIIMLGIEPTIFIPV